MYFRGTFGRIGNRRDKRDVEGLEVGPNVKPTFPEDPVRTYAFSASLNAFKILFSTGDTSPPPPPPQTDIKSSQRGRKRTPRAGTAWLTATKADSSAVVFCVVVMVAPVMSLSHRRARTVREGRGAT